MLYQFCIAINTVETLFDPSLVNDVVKIPANFCLLRMFAYNASVA